MTKEQRTDLENIKRLLLNGSFTLTGVECLALAKAFSTLDQIMNLRDEAAITPPVYLKKKKAIRDNDQPKRSI